MGKQLRNGKVVHLRVILKSIAFSGRNASGILKDPTGMAKYLILHMFVVCGITESLLTGL